MNVETKIDEEGRLWTSTTPEPTTSTTPEPTTSTTPEPTTSTTPEPTTSTTPEPTTSTTPEPTTSTTFQPSNKGYRKRERAKANMGAAPLPYTEWAKRRNAPENA